MTEEKSSTLSASSGFSGQLQQALNLAARIQDAILLTRDHQICYCHPSIARLCQSDPQKMIGRNFDQLIDPVDRPVFQELKNELVGSESTSEKELSLIFSRQSYSRVGVRLLRLSDQDDHVVVRVSNCDSQSARFLKFNESADKDLGPGCSFWLEVADDRISQISVELVLLLGYSQDAELLGRSASDLLVFLDQKNSDVDQGRNSYTQLVRGFLKDAFGQKISIHVLQSVEAKGSGQTTRYSILKNISILWLMLIRQFNLTQRESDVVWELCRGKTSRALADQLQISPATVRTHLRNIFSKFGVNSRIELVCMIFNRMLAHWPADFS